MSKHLRDEQTSVTFIIIRSRNSLSKSLKEELAWAIDKRLQVVNNKMLFKTVIPLRNQRKRPF